MKNAISYQLAVLFYLSFTSGSFPTILKTSKVTPTYKKDSKLNCSDYRPISLLSNIDRVLKRIVYNCLYKLVYNLQFAFWQKHSITHALIHLIKKIRKQLDSGKYGCGIFVDLHEAFDTVDHTTLTQIIGFPLILKTERNLSILIKISAIVISYIHQWCRLFY